VFTNNKRSRCASVK